MSARNVPAPLEQVLDRLKDASAFTSTGKDPFEALARINADFAAFEKTLAGRSPADAAMLRQQFFSGMASDPQVVGLIRILFEKDVTHRLDWEIIGRPDHHLDHRYVDRLLNGLDGLKKMAPEALGKMAFACHAADPKFVYRVKTCQSTPPAVREFMARTYLDDVPDSATFQKAHGELFEPIDREAGRRWAAGSRHFLADARVTPRTFRQNDFRPELADYINPTEHNPGDSRPIVSRAPNGAYVTVGTERGFVSAAMEPNITHLVTADMNVEAVEYNRMNTALLRVARDRKDYLHLRLEAGWPEILERLKADPQADGAALWSDNRRARWWRYWQQGKDGFILLNSAPDAGVADHAFKSANYLHDDEQFARISRMARENRIANLLLDLSDRESVKAVVDEMSRKGVALSVLDVSDTWYDSPRRKFLSTRQSAELIEAFRPVSRDNSVILMTSWYSKKDGTPEFRGVETRRSVLDKVNPERAQWGRDKAPLPFWKWNYFGFTYDTIAEPGDSLKLIESVNANYVRKNEADRRLAGTLNGEKPDRAAPGRKTVAGIFAKLDSFSGKCQQLFGGWFGK